jgi:hypothetical protein
MINKITLNRRVFLQNRFVRGIESKSASLPFLAKSKFMVDSISGLSSTSASVRMTVNRSRVFIRGRLMWH